MRKILLLSIMLFSGLCQAFTQITLTPSDLPVIGNIQISIRVDSLQASSLSPGSAGENQLWNFSNLIPCCGIPGSLDTVRWLNRMDVDGGNNFPGSELATNTHCYTYHSHITHQDEIACYHNFYFKDSQGLKLYGTDYPVKAISQQYQLIQALQSYGASQVVPARTVYSISVDSLRIFSLVDSILTDGWGTLITPIDTFNTLRIRTVENAYDTLFINGNIAKVVVTQGKSYKWYTNGIRFPLLQINSGSFSKSAGSQSVEYSDKSYDVLGIDETTLSQLVVRVFPNPFSQSTTFHFGEIKPGEKLSLILYNLTGEQVTTIGNIAINDFVFSRENLPNGMYFYRIVSAIRPLSSGKIIIQ